MIKPGIVPVLPTQVAVDRTVSSTQWTLRGISPHTKRWIAAVREDPDGRIVPIAWSVLVILLTGIYRLFNNEVGETSAWGGSTPPSCPPRPHGQSQVSMAPL